MELTERVAVVTGGASGIGKALVERFAVEAVRGIVVADIDEVGAIAVAGDAPGRLVAVGCDVAIEAQVNALIDRAEKEFGTVDIFCANAGIAVGAGLEATDDVWNQVMHVNLMSHVYAARRLVPGWLERGGGYFVATASAAGLLSQIGDVTYTVSKHGVVAFAEWLEITYGDRGVRVSCLCPMGVDTPMVRRGLETDGPEGLGPRVVAASSTLLDPAEVANEVVATLKEERFFVLPHPEVGEFYRRKSEDPERWLGGMKRLQARVTHEMRRR